MRIFLAAMMLSGSAYAVSACGSDCAQAIDKELECMEDGKMKEKIKGMRDLGVKMCEAAPDSEEMKDAIECGKKDSCDEFNKCKKASRAKKRIARLKEKMAEGAPQEAAQSCSFDIETYKEVESFKAACDEAFEATFAKLDDKKVRDSIQYSCSSSKEADAWMEASPAMKKGCNDLVAKYKSIIEAGRDKGDKHEYGNCMSYERLVKKLAPKEEAAAKLLCAESSQAEYATKAIAEAQKRIKEGKASVPYQCNSFITADEKKLKGSKWHAKRAAEVAKVCYGDLGKVVLGKVTTYCGRDAKNVHKFAKEYKLGSDAALAALITKTEPTCNK